jgi:hypothetical protein
MELLRLWQTIYQEAVELCEAIEALPDLCECGDADAHLEGRCPCCMRPEQTRGRAGLNCGAIIASIQADLAMLSEDVALAGPATEATALECQRRQLRRSLFLAVTELNRIVESFKRVTESVMGFRVDCMAARMRVIKQCCSELRDDCERVNTELLAGGASSAERPEMPNVA